MGQKIDIIKSSDEILEIRMPYEEGTFQFSETNLTNVTLLLKDSGGSTIATFTKSGNTLVPVTISYDASGNKQYTVSDDTDYFIVYMNGTATSGKKSGFMDAQYTITRTNTNFSDDTYDLILTDKTDYYLKDA